MVKQCNCFITSKIFRENNVLCTNFFVSWIHGIFEEYICSETENTAGTIIVIVNLWMQDPRYKHEYLDRVQSWVTVNEENGDESDKHV